MADEVGTGIDAEIAAVERTLSDLKAKRASKAQLEATRREGSKPLEGDHADSQPLDTSCDPPKPARRPDGSKLRFVKQRARFSAVSGALGELRGQHVDMDIEEADAKALPQLNPRIESQFRWLQFMVWRRWMAGAALAISLCILAVTIWNTMLKFEIQQDQLRRCREGGLNGFEATYDPPQAASTVLDDMIKPFETAQVWRRDRKGINYTAGVDQGVFLGECRWAPFAPFETTMPAAPVAAASSTGSSSTSTSNPFASLQDAAMPFLTSYQKEGVGCHASLRTQHAQQQSCVCAINLQVRGHHSSSPLCTHLVLALRHRALTCSHLAGL